MKRFWKWLIGLFRTIKEFDKADREYQRLERKLEVIKQKSQRHKKAIEEQKDYRTNHEKLVDYLRPGYTYPGWKISRLHRQQFKLLQKR